MVSVFQHTAARRWLERARPLVFHEPEVSTHSRPKAAGRRRRFPIRLIRFGFNTQPPEGGWMILAKQKPRQSGFNTQPPEGGWVFDPPHLVRAGSFNTQPPEGGWA